MPIDPSDRIQVVEPAAPYLEFEEIDFARLIEVLRSLSFFDDVFLNMQALNVGLVDQMITEMEYGLLRELREMERTPTESALLVSALSQMWSFGLYELLRTWRQRIRNYRRQFANGMLKELAKRLEVDSEARRSVAALIQARQIRSIIHDPGLLDVAETHWLAIGPAYRALETFRINLAKHEVPGKPNILADFPGYGRINGFCGALDFSLVAGDRTELTLSRRDIADLLRATELPSVVSGGHD